MPVRTVRASTDDGSFGEVAGWIARKMRERCVCVFTGAGVSRPSGLPVSRDLVAGLVDVLCDALQGNGLTCDDQLVSLRRLIQQRPLERILDAMVAVHGNAPLLYLDVLKGVEENFNHRAVARLAAADMLHHVVTLNFDVLFEQALRSEGLSIEWDLPLASSRVLIGARPSRVAVVKLHGTLPIPGFPYERHYLASTLRHAGDRPQPENDNALRAIAKLAPVLVVAGYSDQDWDISPILMSIEWDAVYWCQHGSDPPVRVQHWLESRQPISSTVIRGDARELWAAVLAVLGVRPPGADDRGPAGTWIERPCRTASARHLQLDTLRSAMAAIALVEEVDRSLYGTLLTSIGSHRELARDPHLWAYWVRASAWYEHIQHRDFRTAIRLRNEATTVPRNDSMEGRLNALEDKVGVYYEHLSVLKRFYRYPLWPLDVRRAASLRGAITEEAQALRKAAAQVPWVVKESDKSLALSDYYVIDLYHNWGYHLLPWGDAITRGIARRVFTLISSKYDSVLTAHPSRGPTPRKNQVRRDRGGRGRHSDRRHV